MNHDDHVSTTLGIFGQVQYIHGHLMTWVIGYRSGWCFASVELAVGTVLDEFYCVSVHGGPIKPLLDGAVCAVSASMP